ncbi:MAG: deoxyribonuclease IV [Pseudomonadota bacterium]
MRIGIHTSIARSLEDAALKAAELGANTFQIFSASPRMWRASAPAAAGIERLRAARERHDLTPLVVHDSYLINLAAADETIRRKSIAAFRGELERAAAIGAEYLVAHPGSYKGQSLDEGLQTFARSLAAAAGGLDTGGITLLLESTAGAGAALGGRFQELAALRKLSAHATPLPVAYCLDTCHLLAAGYDVATAAGLRRTVAEAENILGLANVKVIHANDSKGPLGSRIDRHQNIGEGYIGTEGFHRILTHPKLRGKVFILETPVANEGDDLRNVEALKSLCRKRPMTTTRSS